MTNSKPWIGAITTLSLLLLGSQKSFHIETECLETILHFKLDSNSARELQMLHQINYKFDLNGAFKNVELW